MDWEVTSVSHGSHDDSHDSHDSIAGSLAHSLSRPTLSGLVLVSYICFESKWQLTKKLNNVYYKDYIHTQSLVLNFAASLYTSRAALWRARRKLKKLTKLLILTWHRGLMQKLLKVHVIYQTRDCVSSLYIKHFIEELHVWLKVWTAVKFQGAWY